MKISNKLFLTILKEKLSEMKKDLTEADSVLYYNGRICISSSRTTSM